MKKIVLASAIMLVTLFAFQAMPSAHAAIGFVERGVVADTPGLLSGLWHGMVAPYALVVGLFNPIVGMYAHPNAGLAYDFGFLVGVAGSLPGGWVLAIISLLLLIA
jgi:hypothetical protein